MSIELLTLLFFVLLFILVFSGLPIGFVLGGVSVIFLFFCWGTGSLYMVAAQAWGAMNEFILLALPLFILMAMILEKAGIADSLYEMMHMWFGPVRGGLAVGTVIICTIFAALCGISGTAAVTMGTIALPAMLKRRYDKRLAIGCINSGAGWGILMPPSIDMIVYALIAGESVGRLFAGGVMPTFLLLALDTVYILLRSYIQPSLAPALPKSERADWPTKLRALKSLILPFFIIAAVMGSIVSGAATPTEAAAVGVLGSVVTAIVNKRFTWRLLWEAAQRSFTTTMMVMWIIFGAYCFGATFQGIGGSQLIVSLMKYVPGDRWGAIIFFEIVIFLLAMVMGSTAIMMITLPIFLPVVKAYGFDTLWYGILFIINMEIGYMTPPFGYNLFYLKAVSPPGITMKDIYQSVIWFVMVESTGFILVMIFPEIATWLPTVLFGKS